MKKISKVVAASAVLFTLANPLQVFAEGNITNISTTSGNKVTQDVVISATEVNGEIVFEVTAVKDTYDAILHATIDGKKYTYNLGNLKKGQVSKVVQVAEGKEATISKENKGPKALPNTSTVRQLVEKEINYNNNINGKVVEASLVYKVYELVEVNEGNSTVPVATPGEGDKPKPPVAEPGDGNKPTTPPEVTPQPQPTPPGDGSNQPQPAPSGVTKINSEVTKADPGNVIVGLKGEFDTPNKDAILAEINRIRKEAVDQGLADKYVPIKWSTDLEKTALVRAAEASVTVGQHARLTNKNIWTAYPDRVGSENLAWNNSGINKAIQQWYGEKADFIKKKNGEAVSGQTGHYKSLIDPNLTYMGIAAFRNSKAPYGGVTAAQALASSGNSESLVGTYGKAVLYTEATESKLPEYKQKADLEQK